MVCHHFPLRSLQSSYLIPLEATTCQASFRDGHDQKTALAPLMSSLHPEITSGEIISEICSPADESAALGERVWKGLGDMLCPPNKKRTEFDLKDTSARVWHCWQRWAIMEKGSWRIGGARKRSGWNGCGISTAGLAFGSPSVRRDEAL